MATINEFGATPTTLQEYLTLIRDAHLDIDPNWDLDPSSPDGQAIAVTAELLANLDEQVVYAYQSIDPLTAVKKQLHRIGDISGIVPQEATASTATVTLTGVDGTVVPAGTEVLNVVTNTVWTTDTQVTILGGEATVNVTCQTLGPQVADAGDLSSISYPGVTGVTNDDAASLGTPEELDPVYRVRRNLSVAKPGNNQKDSMFAEIANLDGVKKVKIIENFESAPDSNGVEGHSLAVFVDGGEVSDIAAAMAASKNPGCGLNRTNSYPNKIVAQTETPEGSPFEATFYRPELTTIYVSVQATGVFNVDDLKQAIVDYANATLFDTEGLGFDRTGFDIGDTIAAGKLFTPANSVVGDNGYVSSILIGDDEYDVNYPTVNVGFNGLGAFDVDNIEVIVS